MAYSNKLRRLQGFVAMPDGYRRMPRLQGLLTQIAGDFGIDLIFGHERLPTHSLLIKNLHRFVARSDLVLCYGQDPDVAFQAGLAVGLQKPFVFVILPETQRLPATFMGHFCVELSGDVSDHECLRSALESLVAGLARKDGKSATRSGRSVRLARLGCAVGAGDC